MAQRITAFKEMAGTDSADLCREQSLVRLPGKNVVRTELQEATKGHGQDLQPRVESTKRTAAATDGGEGDKYDRREEKIGHQEREMEDREEGNGTDRTCDENEKRQTDEGLRLGMV